jgi:GNAT superfamily N-acetyltransferase/predicted kinase
LLRIQSEQEFPQFVGYNAEREMASGQAGISDLLAAYPSEGTLIWGAFESDRLIGVLAMSRRLSPKYRHKAFLWGMYVVPELRGRAVAHALMETAITWATEHPDVIAISLQVARSNLRGRQFYKRFGFTTFGIEQRSLFAAGQFHDVYCMEQEVKRARQSVQTDVHLVAFKGLPGCGKTTLSKALGQRLRWPVVSKDDFSLLLDERIADYGALAHELMWRVAASLLDQRLSILCDSTLLTASHYAEARRVADEAGAHLLIVECFCSDQALWQQRIEARDGLPARYLRDWAAFQKYTQDVRLTMNYPIEAERLMVDTAEPLEDVLNVLTKRLDAMR